MMRGGVIATASLLAVALSRQRAQGLSQLAATRQFEGAPPSSFEQSALALAEDAAARGSFKAISSVEGDRFARPEQRKKSVIRFFLPGLIWLGVIVIDHALWWRLIPGVAGGVCTNRAQFIAFHVVLLLMLLSHLSVVVSDPGFIPIETMRVPDASWEPLRWCDRCRGFKPPRAHHCRRCGACIARMDHHCIYAANCVGAGNHKQFLLLLLYSAAWTSFAAALSVTSWRCLVLQLAGPFPPNGVKESKRGVPFALLARTAACLSATTLLVLVWIAALLVTQCYGIAMDTGIVDRMQRAAELGACRSYKTSESQGKSARHPSSASQGLQGHLEEETVEGSVMRWFAAESGEEASRVYAAPHSSTRVVFDLSEGSPQTQSQLATSDGTGGQCRYSCPRAVVKRWAVLREEILGEDSWPMWLMPLPAKHPPKVSRRLHLA